MPICTRVPHMDRAEERVVARPPDVDVDVVDDAGC
jgi:hypothetical protein